MGSAQVCIVIPPSPFLLDERVFPFLGPLKVAASLERAGWGVEVLDLSGIKNFLEAIEDHVHSSNAVYWGITATTPQFPAAVQIAVMLRRVRPGARIIIGGTHASLTVAAHKYEMKCGRVGRAHRSYAQLVEYFDTIVAGDGEEAIFAACSKDAPKLIDADGRKSPEAQYFLNNERLNGTAYPARHLIDLPSYRYTIDGTSATSLIAQLGCPFECGFCAGRLSPMLRHIRTRTTKNIVEEMVSVYREYGHRGFMFYDDELNVSPTMLDLMLAIKDAQHSLGVEWRLRGFIKAELFTEAQAKAMYEAGFRWMLVGFESGSPRILHNIKKKATQQENARCLELAKKQGLKTKALMSVGHPGESHDTVLETTEWLLGVRPDDFDAAVITPYPGSPYYDQALPCGEGTFVYTAANGDKLYQAEVNYAREADYYKGNPDEGYVSHVWTDTLSSKDLVDLRDQLEREVRKGLGVAFNSSRPAVLYEHSMGQTRLPSHILRSTLGAPQ